MVWGPNRCEDRYTRAARKTQELIDHAEKGDLGYSDRKVPILLYFCIIGVGLAVFLLIRDMFDMWYYPALITMIPAISIPVLIEVIRRKRRGY
jgi:hypothetical protein